MEESLLKVKDLKAGYQTQKGNIMAVNNVNFDLKKGEFLGVAGESGCGKSTLAYSIMRLLEDNGHIFSGEIIYKNKNMARLDKKEIKNTRWSEISMVFQSAMNALNPVLSIKAQLLDVMKAHTDSFNKKDAVDRAKRLLKLVNINPERLNDYPHQLSGGMKQRIIIAMAMALDPEIVILDEPTTALDVVVQRNIIEQIDELSDEFGFSVIFITHDLSLLVEITDRLAIMYAGKFVELGLAREIYQNPLHPYTKGLMNSFPPLTGEIEVTGGIPGKPPDFLSLPAGCNFQPRCDYSLEKCQEAEPSLTNYDEKRLVSCYWVEEECRNA